MKVPEKILITELFRRRVRCDQGLDHGFCSNIWMHPPLHRVFGFFSKPSSFRLVRHAWSLKQLCAISYQELYVKGLSEISDQSTVDRIPNVFESDLLDKNSNKIGTIADCFFNTKSGNIDYYLVSRTDPRLPGTSRWKLAINKIVDYKPGTVFSFLSGLDDLPIARSSIRQDLIKRTKTIKDQIQDFSSKASDKLEGWLETPPWEDEESDEKPFVSQDYLQDPLDNWHELDESNDKEKINDYNSRRSRSDIYYTEDDPWI